MRSERMELLHLLRDEARDERRSWAVQVAESVRRNQHECQRVVALELYVEACQRQALYDDLLSFERYGMFWDKVTPAIIAARARDLRAAAYYGCSRSDLTMAQIRAYEDLEAGAR
jgi:hypothetical protein